ncbi:MAG: helix-turn-helix domain-containing protein [Lachnospiraceae bacterium]|nr:MarR family transcriptional regulator [Lachnospiraceae bacterium]MEE1341262.1 helix-turn-helix domain-containing protein [Lachnospiraceae bacterium]
MDYLNEVFNIKVKYQEWKEEAKLPYMITDRYSLRIAFLNQKKVIFAYVKGDVEPASTIKKHFLLIHKVASLPIVLILNKCSARQRKALIKASIPFVVENKQIFLPFMGMLLQEKYDCDCNTVVSLMPSSQVLLFYYIYSKKKELLMSEIVDALGFSAMTITRAVKQLEAIGLINTYKKGVLKIITSEYMGRELYEKASDYLCSPIQKKGYIEKCDIPKGICKAGYYALSEYSMLNPPKILSYATEKLKDKSIQLEDKLSDSEMQQSIEIWTYDPDILAMDGCVDILSLHQSLKEDFDERVQGEINEILDKYWEDYYGERI